MINSLKNQQGSILAILLLFCSIFSSGIYAQDTPEWIAESNGYTEKLLDVIAKHSPESAARLGVEGLDHEITDLSEGFNERAVLDLNRVKEYLKTSLAETENELVRQDLLILIESTENNIEEINLEDTNLLPYYNATSMIYNGIRGLLEDRIPQERRLDALVRLKRYAGNEKGYTPLTILAREEMEREWNKNSDRIAPYRDEVERDLKTSIEYIKEIEGLFKKYEIKGFEKDYKKLVAQLENYHSYIKEEILPNTRTDFKLPLVIYSFNLKEYGVDMPIEELQRRAMVAFKELQTQLQVLGKLIATKNGYPSDDYRDVLRAMKKEQLDSANILTVYRKQIKEIEGIIKDRQLLTLPDREMTIRLASPAESAAAPAPFMSPPRLIGNTGEYGEFVLPLKATGGSDGTSLKIDDFTHLAASWPLTAHEGRPGHELQFTAMVERGVSQARVIFAANSVNIEGWALYAEEIIQPFLPIEGQFMTLWSRLVRSGRAFLDPGLNLGTITQEDARYILSQEIGLSEALVRSELERYQFRAPGQATSYFNGYLRLMELRAETELILGEKFDQHAFHDFVLGQGLLPPRLIKKAVLEEFIPSYN
ncbi:DUF885 domain-containing protein [Eudoraea adriatica]|uniref:DUF885 domain-containing protein n=1 Tax=Eudoraea adriatica TaxID=446681 RepID=UPI00035ECA6B|nr:DUF885 domain-containing protein [Eudoraea adriatica]